MTTLPPLEEQLAAHARDARRADELLEAVAAGTVTPAERAELDRRAADDPALRAAIERCQPLDAASRDRLIHQLTLPSTKVVSIRHGAGRSVAIGLVLAAGLAAVMLLPSGFSRQTPVVQYSLEASGDSAVRGTATAEPVRVSRASHLTLVARPAQAVAPPSSVQLFVTPSAPRAFRLLDTTPQRSPDGAVRIELEGATLGPPGRYLLKLIIGEGDGATSLETDVELMP